MHVSLCISHKYNQWRTHKFFMGGVQSVAYGGHLFVVGSLCDVTIWRHSCFQTNVLVKFVDIICIFPTRTPLILCVIALNINYQRSKLGYWRKINSFLRHRSSQLQRFFCVLKKESKTHSSPRQSNLQPQNEAVRMYRRIQAVEHRCAAGVAGAHPGLQDRILLNYTTGLPTCLHQKKTGSTFEAYTHKTWTTTHKIDIKTRRNRRYNASPIFWSIFVPVITLTCICFSSITSIIFRATVKFLQYSVHPAW